MVVWSTDYLGPRVLNFRLIVLLDDLAGLLLPAAADKDEHQEEEEACGHSHNDHDIDGHHRHRGTHGMGAALRRQRKLIERFGEAFVPAPGNVALEAEQDADVGQGGPRRGQLHRQLGAVHLHLHQGPPLLLAPGAPLHPGHQLLRTRVHREVHPARLLVILGR
uniref:Putative secreted protein n=1 Tax=Ixodes ricinus TaxID=34613 RepID=A0A6B0UY50_IXORI